MPHFDRFAYTHKRCYDMTREDLGDLEPVRAATTLQPYEIDTAADCAKIKGADPVTRAQCVEFFGEAGAECAKYSGRWESALKQSVASVARFSTAADPASDRIGACGFGP
jgi:hypothetical protein